MANSKRYWSQHVDTSARFDPKHGEDTLILADQLLEHRKCKAEIVEVLDRVVGNQTELAMYYQQVNLCYLSR